MKLNISVNDSEKPKIISISIPRWLYMNSLSVSLFALRKDVAIKPKQARKTLRAVKKVMRKKNLTQLAKVEVIANETVVNIDL